MQTVPRPPMECTVSAQVPAVQAFPFHLVMDRDRRLVQMGPALRRICPGLQPGADLAGHFCVPHGAGSLPCEHLFDRAGDDVVVVHVGNGLRLRGEVVLQDAGDRLLFLGTPWVAEPRKLPLVAAHSDSAVILTDARGRVEWVNEAFTRITGYHLHDVIGRPPGKVLQGPATDPAVVRRMGTGCAAGAASARRC